MDITKFAIPEIIFGTGSMKHLTGCARRHGARKVMLVSDTGLERSGWVQRVADLLDADGLRWVYFNKVDSNPRDHHIHEGAEFYLEQEADVIVGLGGGSSLDTAKGIALIASNGGTVTDYEGANRVKRPLPPMIFLPSTAGSGSDISQFAIITDNNRKVKMTLLSRSLVPNISIIDPLFLKTKPTSLIVASAIDALAHAIEAFTSRLASPFTEVQSLRAIRLIISHLGPAVRTRAPEHLEKLSIASTSASMAFSNAGLGVEHSLAHSLGGLFDIIHGLVHPVMLPAVMRFNLPSCVEKMSKVGKTIIGRRSCSNKGTALAGIDRLEEFFAQLDVPVRLSQLLPDKHSLPQVCKMALLDVCTLTNPREPSCDDLVAICEEAW